MVYYILMNEASQIWEYDLLTGEVSAYADLLTSEAMLKYINEHGHRASDVARYIGKVAGALATVGDTQEGISLADNLLEKTRVGARDTFSTWYCMGNADIPQVRERLYGSIGLPTDETLDGEKVDWENAPVIDFVRMGDARAIKKLRERINNTSNDADSITFKTHWAVEVYKADPTAQFSEVTRTARRARDYVLSNAPAEEEPATDEADDISNIISVFSRILTPHGSAVERAFAQTDIALRYFAEDMLRAGKIEEAEELQQLMLSSFYVAELNSVRVMLNLDPEGTYATSVVEYLAVFGDDQGSHAREMSNNLVIGGYEPFVEQYRTILYDPRALSAAEDIDPSLLVALHKSGDFRAHAKLLELYPHAGESQWQYIHALREMGKDTEATQLAYDRFRKEPTFSNGLEILHYQFDINVYLSMRPDTQRSFYQDPFDAIRRKVTAMGYLAAYVGEQRQNQHE